MIREILEDVIFRGRVYFQVPPDTVTSTLKGIAIENVTGGVLFKCSGVVVTVTNFTGGVDGWTIRLVGDGTTTISNNTTIKTNTGANKLLVLNKVYTFSYVDKDKTWYENA